MFADGKIYLGLAESVDENGARKRVCLEPSQANRHGLIAGASGTGKTVTMKVMAESFSDMGVPVFLCDVKGDVSGLAQAGVDNEGMQKRIDKFGIRSVFSYRAYPVTFWDIYGKGGHPVRTTVSDMGPDLLAQILELSEIQASVLSVVFRIADEHGLEILDLKDLRAVLSYVTEHRQEYSLRYGNMAAASLASISRALIPLEDQGAEQFFGEPALDVFDWMRTDEEGRGMINILHSVESLQYPKLYAMFLLWMMAELFEKLPEVGDGEKPKMVFFFDEAHLLFNNAPHALMRKIEQVVKLIRSKGVGIYFVTQSPSDLPDVVLAQLSNRVQHALRAYTPSEQKSIRAAAAAFRKNPAFKTEEALTELGTGEALVSCLDEKGVPQIVEKVSILCPQSLMAACDPSVKEAVLANSPFAAKYDAPIDNESAYELLVDSEEEPEESEETSVDSAEEAKEETSEDSDAQKAKDALAAEREQLEKEKKAFEEEKRKAAEKAEKEKEKQKEKEEKAKEKEKEKKKAARKKASDRRWQKIETQLISTGGSLLRRGLLNILKKK